MSPALTAERYTAWRAALLVERLAAKTPRQFDQVQRALDGLERARVASVVRELIPFTVEQAA